ncbi:hypothetical protein C2S52_020493 [Perilla frutescens var. hirtella]|nr:hypothetical protein C2S52_020493 [Perilla frutescens var. hirtella]
MAKARERGADLSRMPPPSPPRWKLTTTAPEAYDVRQQQPPNFDYPINRTPLCGRFSTAPCNRRRQNHRHICCCQTNSVLILDFKCFDLTSVNVESDHGVVLKELPLLFSHLGSTVVDLFFLANKNGVNWIEFLRGYTKYCARTVASALLNNLFRVFSVACLKAELPVDLQFEVFDDDCKISGSLSPVIFVCFFVSAGLFLGMLGC